MKPASQQLGRRWVKPSSTTSHRTLRSTRTANPPLLPSTLPPPLTLLSTPPPLPTKIHSPKPSFPSTTTTPSSNPLPVPPTPPPLLPFSMPLGNPEFGDLADPAVGWIRRRSDLGLPRWFCVWFPSRLWRLIAPRDGAATPLTATRSTGQNYPCLTLLLFYFIQF